MTVARRRTAALCAGALLLAGCAAQGAAPAVPTQSTAGRAEPVARAQPVETTQATQPTTEVSTDPCTAGDATGVTWDALGVDAPVEQVGVDTEAEPDANGGYPLGDPEDIDAIGWYADGPQPGSGSGHVLLDGHTYTDGSAVFSPSFDAEVAVGQEFTVTTSTGGECTYRVTEVFTDVAKVDEYPDLVAREDLYVTDGPEQAVVVTCSGEFDESSGHHLDVTVVVAERV